MAETDVQFELFLMCFSARFTKTRKDCVKISYFDCDLKKTLICSAIRPFRKTEIQRKDSFKFFQDLHSCWRSFSVILGAYF